MLGAFRGSTLGRTTRLVRAFANGTVHVTPESQEGHVDAVRALISSAHTLLDASGVSDRETMLSLLTAAQETLPSTPAGDKGSANANEEGVGEATALVVLAGERNTGKTTLHRVLTSSFSSSSSSSSSSSAEGGAGYVTSTSHVERTSPDNAAGDSLGRSLGVTFVDTPPLERWEELLGEVASRELLTLAEHVVLVTDPARAGGSGSERALVKRMRAARGGQDLVVVVNKKDLVADEKAQGALKAAVGAETGVDASHIVLASAGARAKDESGLGSLGAALASAGASDAEARMVRALSVRLGVVDAANGAIRGGLEREKRVLERKEDEILRLINYVEDEAADMMDAFDASVAPVVTDHFDTLVDAERTFFRDRTVLDLIRLPADKLRVELAEQRLFSAGWLSPIEASLAGSMASTLETARQERLYMLEALTQFAADPAMGEFPLTADLRSALAAAHAEHTPAELDGNTLTAKLAALASSYDREAFEADVMASMKRASQINYGAQLGSLTLLSAAYGYTQLTHGPVDTSTLSLLLAGAGASSFTGLWALQSSWMKLQARLDSALASLRKDILSSLPDAYASVVRKALKPMKKTLGKCYSAATQVSADVASLDASLADLSQRSTELRNSLNSIKRL